MAILVVGGAGYIGSHTVSRLIERGYEVVVFDNLETGHRAAVHPEASFVQGTLRNKAEIDQVMETYAIEGIMNFAAYIQVGESMEKPFEYFRANVDTFRNLLESASEHGVKRVILSSTAALFGDPETMPISESEKIQPGSVYGETKYFCERLLHWMDEIYGMKYCALRYFNACGAHPNGQIGEDHRPESHLIPLILQVAMGQRDEITIFGDDYDTPDGTCIRDYVHVLDLADAHILAFEALKEGESRVYNLGNGDGYSVREVIDTVRKVTGHSIPTSTVARRSGDLATLIADSAKIRRELNWQPAYSDLEQIVETAWRWHQSHPLGYDD